MQQRNVRNFVKALSSASGIIMLVFLSLIQTRCAQETVPQGGAIDSIAPKLVKASPPDKSLYFAEKNISIRFSEFLKETGFAQTLVSPPLDKRPEFHIEGRTLSIKLKSPLRDSTTYTINFADDIKDLNEGNTAKNFTYVFSTGSYIDSQKITGTVILAKDNEPQDGIVVALYPEDTIDGITKLKPFYFTKTDKNGLFSIQNVKAGNYNIYALKDQNYDYQYDQPNELIAFSDSTIIMKDSLTPNVKLYLFDENKRKLDMDEVRSIEPGRLTISYTRPIKTFKLDWRGYSNSDFAYLNNTNDTVTYWYSKYYQQKDTFYLTANDSIFDTARIELKTIQKDSVTTWSKYSLNIVNQSSKSLKDSSSKQNTAIQELNKPLKINFSRPVLRINESNAIKISSDSGLTVIEPKFLIDEKTKLFISADFSKKEGTKYTVEIPDSSLQDIFGVWNRKMNYQFTTNRKDSYGSLHITLKTEHPENYYVIKLLDAAGETIKEFFFTGNGERKVSVDNILAGSYKFVVIEDTNRNGQWDTGNFKDKIQPEKIFTYKDNYQLKGGWDLDVVVKF